MAKSPLPTNRVIEKTRVSFSKALDMAVDGKKITREEWEDTRTYGLIKDGLLQIHKAGEGKEVVRPWIVNDGDILGKDWYAI